MKERAYAKINLCLDVVGKREDGYHDLKMIMIPINFYDVLEMEFAEETTLELNRDYLPINDKNTIIKAIHIMQERYNIEEEFRCRLEKHIPTRAGLAGGSADAAAAIRMINRMCNLHLTKDEMIAAGKEVGADVPFCILNRPAFVEGIGEKITTFSCNPDFYLLLIKPRKGVSTAEAFHIVDEQEGIHPDCKAMQKALEYNDYEGIIVSLGNSMENAAMTLVPEIRKAKQDLLELGFDGVLMSGSGSTVFGITRDVELLDSSIDVLKKKRYFVRKTTVHTR
ncbi:4-(cytidine 5'-diphospho)-2-C-methyl-D-erythritol kinase [Solobacterium moorei]|uniref:4-(cytidine 5'-diphospho)-2-C-methyl-D-erythritol kinase n=1 Tax=Solobacterium moorei TaxID=102148 RepID=UPI000428A34D|nr:4-(cytidine 5'-diphospho)-2-C-methyl-D-erythritol kinase [Solobacterium moorei]BET20452.1 4-(cytidine 5'-diphospho)-2-C-methyl-D-erythritol kinase [Solobacterium moorei]